MFKTATKQRQLEAPLEYAREKQNWITNAVKLAIDDLQILCVDKEVTNAVPKQRQVEDLTPPTQDERIPNIREPTDMYTCYKEWCEECREYFTRVKRPPWKTHCGANESALRIRYCRMRPYFMYLDDLPHDMSVRDTIDKLDAIRKKHKVSVPTFIKQCFYSLQHDVKDSKTKPPPILPAVLREEMEALKLYVK